MQHPLASLSLGAILTFVGGRARRGPRAAGQGAKAAARQEPVADRRGISSLLTAEGVGQIGNMMAIVALPWFVLETTGSAARTGIVSGALALGAVIPAVLGGPLVDRLGFKRSSVLADLASAAVVAAVPLLHLAGVLQFWQLVVLVFVLSSLNAQGGQSYLAELREGLRVHPGPHRAAVDDPDRHRGQLPRQRWHAAPQQGPPAG
jgi:predicted MFS family arabinose efflux permease